MADKTKSYYSVECKIKDVDLSSNIDTIRIISSINAPYQTVITTFGLSSKDLIIEDLLGKDDIDLTITNMSGEDATPLEVTKLKLITIKSDNPLENKSQNGFDSIDSDKLTLINVTKQPFEYMSKTVCSIYDETKLNTPIEIVKDMINKFSPNMNLNIKENGINTHRIDQMIISPMTFMDFVRYLDGTDNEIIKKYGQGPGIFNGPMYFSCRYEEDTFDLWDLSKILKENPEYTIYQLAIGGKDNDLMKKVGSEDNKFYTYEKVETNNRGNQDIIKTAYNKVYRIKPLDKLYEQIETNLDSALDNAIVDKKNIHFNETLKNRKVYHTIGTSGWDYDENFLKTSVSRKFSSMFELMIKMDRRLYINKLSRVGVPIEYKPQTSDFTELQGKYIVNNSDITIRKDESEYWIARANVKIFRGNLKI